MGKTRSDGAQAQPCGNVRFADGRDQPAGRRYAASAGLAVATPFQRHRRGDPAVALCRHPSVAAPAPVKVTLEIWPRRLSEQRADKREPLVLGAESLREVIETDTHIFLTARSGTIIVPATAFSSAKAKDAFAGYWEDFAG